MVRITIFSFVIKKKLTYIFMICFVEFICKNKSFMESHIIPTKKPSISGIQARPKLEHMKTISSHSNRTSSLVSLKNSPSGELNNNHESESPRAQVLDERVSVNLASRIWKMSSEDFHQWRQILGTYTSSIKKQCVN